MSELRLVVGPITELLVQQERVKDGVLRCLTDVGWTGQCAVGVYTNLGVSQRLSLYNETTSGGFRNMKSRGARGTFQVYIFKSV